MFVLLISTDDSENVNLQGGVSLVVNKNGRHMSETMGVTRWEGGSGLRFLGVRDANSQWLVRTDQMRVGQVAVAKQYGDSSTSISQQRTLR